MKTSLVIDDALYRQVKAKAAIEGRKLTELIEDMQGEAARESHEASLRQ